MHAIEDTDALSRLEARIEQLSQLLTRLKDKNAELQKALEHVAAERDQASRAAEEARSHAARLIEETEGLRSRHKEVAARVKALLAQMESIEIPAEP